MYIERFLLGQCILCTIWWSSKLIIRLIIVTLNTDENLSIIAGFQTSAAALWHIKSSLPYQLSHPTVLILFNDWLRAPAAHEFTTMTTSTSGWWVCFHNYKHQRLTSLLQWLQAPAADQSTTMTGIRTKDRWTKGRRTKGRRTKGRWTKGRWTKGRYMHGGQKVDTP